MKSIFVWVIALSIALTVCPHVQGRTDLEQRVEQIFLQEHGSKDELAQLGRGEDVQAVLLNMLAKHKHAEPGTREYLYLRGATRALGTMKAQQSIDSLSQILMDRKVHENVRADAARSLGQIDPEESKQLLLKALTSQSNYFAIRVNAAEALGKTKDAQVLKALEQYGREEQDPYVRQKFEKAAQEVKARMDGRR